MHKSLMPPWTSGGKSIVNRVNGAHVCTVTATIPPNERKELVEYIVRAVNAHDALVAACKAIVSLPLKELQDVCGRDFVAVPQREIDALRAALEASRE